MSHKKVKYMTTTAVLSTLITIMTVYLFHIPTGINQGYVHFGDALIYLGAALLPAPYAMLAGAIGAGIADVLTAPVWAPASMIIKTLLVVPFSRKGEKILTKRNVVALMLAGVISTAGYYIAEGLLFGFTVAIWTSLSGSVIQALGSAVMFVMIAGGLDKVEFKKHFLERL